jgi:hypothetical protein
MKRSRSLLRWVIAVAPILLGLLSMPVAPIHGLHSDAVGAQDLQPDMMNRGEDQLRCQPDIDTDPWRNWGNLGAPGGSFAGNPSAIKNIDGRLEIFAFGGTGVLHHIWQVTPGGEWSNWEPIGGDLLAPGPPVVGLNTDGRLEVFVSNVNGALHHIRQVAPGGEWSDWEPLAGGFSGAGIPAIGRNADGRLEVFVSELSLDGTLWHISQVTPGGEWSNWESLGGTPFGTPAVGRNRDGRLEVFVRGTDGTLHHIWQVRPGGEWSKWESLGGESFGSMVVGQNRDGRLEVFVWIQARQVRARHGWSDAGEVLEI